MAGALGASRLARLVTEVLSPPWVGALVFLLVAARATPTLAAALAWALLTTLLTIALPFAVVLAAVRRRRFSDRWLPIREERPRAFAVGIAAAVAGVAALAALGAPRALVALVVALAAGLVVSLAITLAWKVSIHVASIAGAVAVLSLAFDARALVLTPLVVLVGWARVALGDHTPAQAAAGAATGAIVGGLVFALAR